MPVPEMDDPEVAKAVVKIQAGVRGHLVRRELASKQVGA